jgi:CheY-like chemotaxis protein
LAELPTNFGVIARRVVAPYDSVMAFISPLPVLLVEDDEADQHLTRQSLQRFRSSIEIHTVSSVRAAQAFLSATGPFAQAKRPACIILDLTLSDGSGRELMDWMARHDDLARLPVIIFSGRHEALPHENIACQLAKPSEVSGYEQLQNGLGAILFAAADAGRGPANDNYSG